jgi:N,N-dimethylformamidase beta subunit-like, C-terminal/Domain of unknown function (DUF4082)/Bacterial Ig-like domain/Bacterial Ig domain
MRERFHLRRLLTIAALTLGALSGLSAGLVATPALAASAATDPCSYANINPVPCENAKPGTDSTTSGVGGGDSTSILGFSTDISVNVGATISFKIKTTSTNYTVKIFRVGYYQGDGARQIAVVTPSATLPQNQPACLTVAATGLIDCGNWAASASWAVPSTAVSGVYYALLTDVKSGASSHIPFIVRNDASGSDIVFKTNDTTWAAYNDYGGNSLYYGNTSIGCGAFNQYTCGRATKVSYNRPFNEENEGSGYGTSNYLWYAEYPMIRWLEANGYNVSYISSLDTERAPALLQTHKVILSSGHDEYWSAGERSALEQARNAGVNIASFTGNTAFWKTRWENSIDGANTSYRTLVSYKETLDNKVEDPLDPTIWTGTWRDPRFSPPADGGRPENALLGTIFMVNRGTASPVISANFAKLRFWRNTAVAGLTGSQTATLASSLIGYEWDIDDDNGFRPAGLVDMAATSVNVPELLQDYGNTYTTGTAVWAPTLYRAASGALVFSAGTVQWAWGLDTEHAVDPDAGQGTPDIDVEQATVNLLADMHAQPATLQAGLVAATASTDTSAPTSAITSPAANATVTSHVPVTITGTATDSGGGVVAGAEISLDGGTTWHKATVASAASAATWSYAWTPQAPGSVTIKSRASDDSANVGSGSAAVSVTVLPPSCPCTLFPSTATPATAAAPDTAAVELGVKFNADAPGSVTGVKFYKGTGNTGTHTGSLWSSSGALLATGTFANESASGWQTLTFASPVSIQPNTVYVVSYHTTVGKYSINEGYFTNQYDSWPLHAPSNAVSNGNGVFAYGGSQYPNQASSGSNYWVDVVYSSSFVNATTPAVAAVSPTQGATGVGLVSTVAAGFNKDVTPSSIQFSLTGPNNAQVAGTMSYNATTYTATFTPSAALAASTTYTATVSGATDSGGHSMTSPYTWSFTTLACPCTIFAANATPANITANDSGAVELGVKFRSDVNGYINGVRFYKGSTNTGTHVGNLWSSTGQLLASATFTGETASGWQQVYFSHPVAVTAGTLYVASYHTNVGGYSYTTSGLAANVDNGDLHVPSSGSVSGNGVFAYGGTQFPNGTYNASNYWVDVVFNTQFIDMVPPSVASTTPASNALGVPVGTTVTATFDRSVVAASIQFTVTGPGNQPVPGTTSYNNTTFVASFQPTAPLAAGATYTATVSGATNQAGVAMTAPYTWSFTTPASCPCTLFPASATPAVASAQDASAVELGMKFTADVGGNVTGVRFYKGASNTGTHIGNLWSNTGQLLATVTFTNETASGWQQATFSQPVAITAGTVYVVSYHTNVGFYSVNSGYFASAFDNSPLHGVANGTSPNGVYAYGATQFPNGSYNASNYWVDVVFNPN